MWRAASYQDIVALTQLSQQHYEHEMSEFFATDPAYLAEQIGIACARQENDPHSQLLWVHENNTVDAYVWAAPETTVWSAEPMAVLRMIHIDLTLSARQRVELVKQALHLTAGWAWGSQIPVVCSTTVRADQPAFIRIHERLGYTVRGSVAYLRVIPK